MFNPQISKKWTLNNIYPSGDNPIPLSEYANNINAIGAIPNLLGIINALREMFQYTKTIEAISDISRLLIHLEDLVDRLDHEHGL